MKKLIVLMVLLLICVFSEAQLFGTPYFLIRSDTLKGSDTLEFRTSELPESNWFIGIQADFRSIADNSTLDSIYSEASINGIKYARLSPVNGNIFGFPNTQMGLIGNNTLLIGIVGIPFNYFGYTAYGVVGDTLVIDTYGMKKK